MEGVFQQRCAHDEHDLAFAHTEFEFADLVRVENIALLDRRAIYRTATGGSEAYEQDGNENLSHHQSFSGYTFGRDHTLKPSSIQQESVMESQDLKNAGLKATLPRIKILQFLEQSKIRHMSAEDVYKALLESGEEVGLATVYRVLTQFEQAGLVSRHHFEGGQSVFELNEGKHHDHILCIKCGKVDEFVDKVIEERQQNIARDKGYEMTDHSLYIYGICKDCRQKS